MSFLRHEQIYQSDGVLVCARGEAFAGSAPNLIVLMSLQPAIPRRVALLHCSLPLHRAIAMMNGVAGNRQPPLDRGWGIFNWRNGEFSVGVDTGNHHCFFALLLLPRQPSGVAPTTSGGCQYCCGARDVQCDALLSDAHDYTARRSRVGWLCRIRRSGKRYQFLVHARHRFDCWLKERA